MSDVSDENENKETKEDKDEIRKLKSKYLPYKEDVTEKTLLELKKVSTLDGEIPKKLIEAIPAI
jgi:hypothetical protein